MLRELNFALTGEEKSFIVELWVLTLLSIWILTKFSDLSLHKEIENENGSELDESSKHSECVKSFLPPPQPVKKPGLNPKPASSKAMDIRKASNPNHFVLRQNSSSSNPLDICNVSNSNHSLLRQNFSRSNPLDVHNNFPSNPPNLRQNSSRFNHLDILNTSSSSHLDRRVTYKSNPTDVLSTLNSTHHEFRSTSKLLIVRQPSSSKHLLGLKVRMCELAKSASRHENHVNMCIDLINSYNVDVNEAVLSNGMSVFHCCCLSSSFKLLCAVLPRANINVLTYHRDSPMYLATTAACRNFSKRGLEPDLRVLDALLEAGDDVNNTNLAGFTPLHQAAKWGCEPIARFLRDNGADLGVKSIDSIAPADLSFAFGHTRLTDMISETCNSTTIQQYLH